MTVKCAWCNADFEKSSGHVNRARKMGLNIYCNRTHAGLGRRSNKTEAEKKAEKAQYDKGYCYYHRDGIKEKKAEWFKADYAANPEKYKEQRKRRAAAHNEYCRREEYRAYKREYDKRHLADKHYGEFGDAALILAELEKILSSKQIKYDIHIRNKSQTRKRQWQTSQQAT